MTARTPKINFFATRPHQCSYLDDQQASTLFLDPEFHVTSAIYTRLSEQGFRRSGRHLYRPHCEHCEACIPIRVPVADFKPDRRQRRIWNRNDFSRVNSP